MGEFVNIFHDIAGEVYAVSDNQLLIKVSKSIYLTIYISIYDQMFQRFFQKRRDRGYFIT